MRILIFIVDVVLILIVYYALYKAFELGAKSRKRKKEVKK